ncbi:hypothetical protein ODZ84_08760 [Chryseobacterium fluminis]|nr:hypothetical protein [Chryseobacterium sp. MMS21-Ot14]UZT99639.1 hypothetical protein ODZ84_08760 [Chryseobacterium sp. MMS21-Ot14]
MKEMLKRIFLVAFILLVLTAVSGFFYMQKHPLEGKKPALQDMNLSRKSK